MKFGTNIHHVSENCRKCFQGQRSKVKVICVQMCEYYNSGGRQFDGVVSRLILVHFVVNFRLKLSTKIIVQNFDSTDNLVMGFVAAAYRITIIIRVYNLVQICVHLIIDLRLSKH